MLNGLVILGTSSCKEMSIVIYRVESKKSPLSWCPTVTTHSSLNHASKAETWRRQYKCKFHCVLVRKHSCACIISSSNCSRLHGSSNLIIVKQTCWKKNCILVTSFVFEGQDFFASSAVRIDRSCENLTIFKILWKMYDCAENIALYKIVKTDLPTHHNNGIDTPPTINVQPTLKVAPFRIRKKTAIWLLKWILWLLLSMGMRPL